MARSPTDEIARTFGPPRRNRGGVLRNRHHDNPLQRQTSDVADGRVLPLPA